MTHLITKELFEKHKVRSIPTHEESQDQERCLHFERAETSEDEVLYLCYPDWEIPRYPSNFFKPKVTIYGQDWYSVRAI